MLAAAHTALERYVDVLVDPDGALAFMHAEVPCAVQSSQLARLHRTRHLGVHERQRSVGIDENVHVALERGVCCCEHLLGVHRCPPVDSSVGASAESPTFPPKRLSREAYSTH